MNKLTIFIGATIKDLVDKVAVARSVVKNAADSFKGAFKGMGTIFGGFTGPLMALGSFAGITSMIKSLSEMGKEIAIGSKDLGLSTDEYQRFGKMISSVGGDSETLSTAFRGMSGVITEAIDKPSGDAAQKLALLGVRFDELKGKSPAQQFEMIMRALGGIADPTERMARAVDVFGRGDQALGALAANYDEAAAKAREADVMSSSAIEASLRFEKTLSSLGNSIKILVSESGILEFLDGIVQRLDDVLRGSQRIKNLAAQSGAKGAQTGDYSGASEAFSKGEYLKAAGSAFTAFSANHPFIEGALNAVTAPSTLAIGGLTRAGRALGINKGVTPWTLSGMAEQVGGDAAGLKIAAPTKLDIANASADRQTESLRKLQEEKTRQAAIEKSINDQIAEVERKAGAMTTVNGELDKQARLEEKIKEIETKTGRKMTEPQKERLSTAFDTIDQANYEKAIYGQISSLREKISIQKLINDGKEREAAIQEELARADKEAKANGTTLTDQDRAVLAQGAGRLYDLQNRKQQNPEAPRHTSLEAYGGSYGLSTGTSANSADAQLRKSNDYLAKIQTAADYIKAKMDSTDSSTTTISNMTAR